MTTKRFPTWDDFKGAFPVFLPGRDRHSDAPIFSNYLFRGQMDADWDLVSAFDRSVPASHPDRNAEFQKWLRFFTSMNDRVGRPSTHLPHDEQVAMAQHYGVATRSIDWSLSPYKAAFFCFFDALRSKHPPHRDVAIWAVNLSLFRKCAPVGFAFTKVRWNASDRVRNQLGRFLENRSNYSSVQAYVAAENPELGQAFSKFQVPASEAPKALNDLLLMGISPVDLYPDFEGVAMYVRLRQIFNGFAF